MIIKVEQGKAESVVKRAFWLAFQACGGPVGMGVLQDRPGIDEEAVWKNARTSGDYVGHVSETPGSVSGDYVFGRMMKLRIKYKDSEIFVPDSEPHPAYQSWYRAYFTYAKLIHAACQSLEVEYED